MKAILTQHEKLRALSGNLAPTHQGEQLATEINDLKMAAIHRKDELASALEQQESYEKQVTEISKIITNTRATLEVAPPPATTVEGLQQQITDHNVGVHSTDPVDETFLDTRLLDNTLSDSLLQISTSMLDVVADFDWTLARVIFYRCVVVFFWWIVLTFLGYTFLLMLLGLPDGRESYRRDEL